MKKDIVLFDLDGTLVDTLPAIASSFNYVLEKYSYNTYEIKEYKNFIGKGFSVLFDRVNKLQDIKIDKENFLEEVREHYNKNFLIGINLYKNIDKLLDKLSENNIDLAIVTNKDNDLAKKHAETILSKWNFKYIYGSNEKKYENKPNPYTVNLIAKNYVKDRMLFVGDMVVDYETSKNANIDFIYLEHGYGGEKNFKCISLKDPLKILDYIVG